MTIIENNPQYSVSVKDISDKELIELSEIKQFLRINSQNNSEDELLKEFIRSARIYAEQRINSSINLKIINLIYYEESPKCIFLPYCPVQNIEKILIKKIDEGHETIKSKDYFLSSDGIYLFFRKKLFSDIIDIEYKVGFDDRTKIKENIITAMKRHIFYMYNTRDLGDQNDKLNALYDEIYWQNKLIRI